MNRVQELIFELMTISPFNNFDGEKVVASLKDNESLWISAIFLPFSLPLLTLRDMADGEWNADTLYIIPAEGEEDQLEGLASSWNADEVDWIDGMKACNMMGEWSSKKEARDKALLRVWWD